VVTIRNTLTGVKALAGIARKQKLLKSEARANPHN
jgi:hypothetical protein